MKRATKVGLGIILFTLCFFNSALAAEFGFKAGLLASYTGKIDTIRTHYKDTEFNSKLEHIGFPFSMFLVHNNIKVSYLHYEQYTEKDRPRDSISQEQIKRGTALIRNDAITVGYQHEFLPLPYDIQFFAGADVALFKSTLTLETTYDFAAAGINGTSSESVHLRSTPEISFGFVLNAGVKKYIENVFVSADISYINQSVNFERIPSYQEQVKVDVGGFIVSVGAGVAF